MPFDGPIMIGAGAGVVILAAAFAIRTYFRIRRNVQGDNENTSA